MLLTGNGYGGFAPARIYDGGGGAPNSVVFGDFNDDGRLDIGVGNDLTGSVGVLLNGDSLSLTEGAVDEGTQTVQLDGWLSSDPNQPSNTLSYAWDLDGNGSFETAGMTPTYSTAGLDGPAVRTVTLRVTDNGD